MLSRVADSLYWMSRYFERADHCSRVLEANYILLLNPSKPSREARWNRITEALGLKPDSLSGDSQATAMRLIAQADDLDWVGLLTSCAAVEAYRKVNTSNVSPECVADFLILNPEFPHTIRYAADQMSYALDKIAEITASRKSARSERVIGKLRASLTYVGIDEIMARNLHNYLNSVLEQCHILHAAMHQIFIDYPIESALEA